MTQDPRFGGRPANDSAAWGQRDKPRSIAGWIVLAVVLVMIAGGVGAWLTYSIKPDPGSPVPAPAASIAPVSGEKAIRIETLQEGAGAMPGGKDVVLTNYRMSLADGKLVDQAERSALPIDGLVPGVAQALVQMRRGGKYRVFVPSDLAYGAQGAGPIPPNSDVIFEVELLDFKSRAEIEQGKSGKTQE